MACVEVQAFRLLPKTWHETPTLAMPRCRAGSGTSRLARAGGHPRHCVCDSGSFCSALAQFKSINEGEDALQG